MRKMFDLKLERKEGGSYETLWRKNILGGGNCKYKGPQVQ